MIVFLGDQKLWVEGKKAYSVKDVEERYQVQYDNKNKLQLELNNTNDSIKALNEKKASIEYNLANATKDVEDLGTILKKVTSEESEKVKIEDQADESTENKEEQPVENLLSKKGKVIL